MFVQPPIYGHPSELTLATRGLRHLRAPALRQGRYKSLVIENVAALSRVVDYIHLNPVRAKVVVPEQVGAYRWSSVMALRRTPRPSALVAAAWLQQRGGWADDIEGIRCYGEFLKELAAKALQSKPMKQDWKLALAEDVRQSTGASISWLAANLHLDGAATLRGYLHRRKSGKN